MGVVLGFHAHPTPCPLQVVQLRSIRLGFFVTQQVGLDLGDTIRHSDQGRVQRGVHSSRPLQRFDRVENCAIPQDDAVLDVQ